MKTGDSIDKIEVEQGINTIIEEEILEVMQEHIKILKDKIVEKGTEIIIEIKVMAEVEIGTGLEKIIFSRNFSKIRNNRVQVIVGPDQDQGQVQIVLKIKVLKKT